MPDALYARDEAVGVVTLNRPERLNAMNGGLMAAFDAALRQAIADPECAVIVITGAGRAFCAGDDLKDYDLQIADDKAIETHVAAIQRITRVMMGCDKPIIGAIHGYAVGGGFEWLLNCELVVAADDLVAFFPETELGQFVTGGVTYLLPLALGYQRAMELLLLGERKTARELLALGLVNRVVPRAEMLDVAFGIAKRIAKRSRWSIGRLKTLLNGELGSALWQAVEAEQTITADAFRNTDTAERVARFGTGRRGA
jgi:enoyl-CoA hydratase/carnithine racemase